MTADCRAGYLYFDSLCRNFRTREDLLSSIEHLESWKRVARYLYRMSEYDADLFEEYRSAGAELQTAYHVTPAVPISMFEDRLEKILGTHSKLKLLLDASVILRIHIDTVNVDADRGASIPTDPLERHCVYAVVLDTIKGKHWRNGDSPARSRSPASWEGQARINLTYNPLWNRFTRPTDVSRDGVGGDPLRITAPLGSYGPNALEAGREYIVFLRDVLLDFDGKQSYYDFWPSQFYSPEGGILAIDEHENVLIPSNSFGYGTVIPLTTFVTLIRADIETIVGP